MGRSQSREEAFKLLYSMKFINDSDANEQIKLFIETDEIKDGDTIKQQRNQYWMITMTFPLISIILWNFSLS